MNEQIIAANQTFMNVFAGGAETMGDLYTADAEIYPPGGDTISGNTAIGEFWKWAFGAGIKKAKLDTVKTESVGDQIVEIGKFTLFGESDAQLDTGKYLVVWKQDGGVWKLHRDIWNTSVAS
ncbi:hypothetical protein GCM10028805_51270 [Spirosoma harenae]